MKYSIVMPIYNVEPYLAASIGDILHQTYGDFELILVDDCTPDSSGQICDEFEQKDSRILVRHLEKNQGLSGARNEGMKAASGDYILFLDPDDRYDHTLLAKIESSLKKNPAQVVLYGLEEEYYSADGKLTHKKEIIPETKALKDKRSLHLEVMPLESKTLFGYAWNKAYQLEYLRKQQLEFEKIVMIEDVLFNIQVFRNLDSLNTIAAPLYRYAIRKNGSLTQKYLPDYFKVHEMRVKKMLELHEEWGLCSDHLLEALASIYCRYFVSAVQRNCSAASGMSGSDQRRWIRRQFKSETFLKLKPYMHPDNKVLKLLAWGIRKEKVHYCAWMGKGVYLVKEKCPGIFARLKQNR